MRESQSVIEAWRNEGRAEGRAEGMALGLLEARRADVLRALQLRFQAVPPPETVATVRAMDDLNRLSRWFDIALTATTFDMFRRIADAGDDAGRPSGD